IRAGDFDKSVRYRRFNMLNQASQYYNNYAQFQSFAPDYAHQFLAVAQRNAVELNQGDIIGNQVLNDMIDDILIAEEAEKLGCALFIHPWEMMGETQMEKYWLPWLVGMPAETSRAICSMIFGGVLEKFPNLRIAFAHGGGAFPYTLGRIEHGYKVRPDLTAVDNPINPKNYIGKFWVDSLVHDKASFRYLLDMFGENKICMGSDYPFPLGEHKPGKMIEKMDLGKKLTQKLMYKNAEKWLDLNNKNLPEF
ncbi:MAG TPA: amidohydrolase family protein, partial [Chitinophagaceae bacterium]|nr:amidohydrolase family protein [Chitinophagaceae bacterium]